SSSSPSRPNPSVRLAPNKRTSASTNHVRDFNGASPSPKRLPIPMLSPPAELYWEAMRRNFHVVLAWSLVIFRLNPPMRQHTTCLLVLVKLFTVTLSNSHAASSLPGTAPLTLSGDLSAQMVEGIDRFLSAQTESHASDRPKFWK